MIQATLDKAPEPFENKVEGLLELRRETVDGVEVSYVSVPDTYEPETPEAKAEKDFIQQTIFGIEAGLRSDNFVEREKAQRTGKELLGRGGRTIDAWSDMMTTAMALYPLQRPNAPHLPDGTPVSEFARKLFLYGQDSVGIRSRGAVFKNLLLDHGPVESAASLACGEAVPEFDAIKEMLYKPKNIQLVDYDPEALRHIDEVAEAAGIDPDSYSKKRLDLVKEFILAKSSPEGLEKESFEVVSALGITEYFPDRLLEVFLKKAYDLVKPGGSFIFGNMLDTHPTLKFNQQVVEWPGVIPRSTKKLSGLVADFASPEEARIYIPEDGVYAVVEVKKPLKANNNERGVGERAIRHLRSV